MSSPSLANPCRTQFHGQTKPALSRAPHPRRVTIPLKRPRRGTVSFPASSIGPRLDHSTTPAPHEPHLVQTPPRTSLDTIHRDTPTPFRQSCPCSYLVHHPTTLVKHPQSRNMNPNITPRTQSPMRLRRLEVWRLEPVMWAAPLPLNSGTILGSLPLPDLCEAAVQVAVHLTGFSHLGQIDRQCHPRAGVPKWEPLF